jgi:hypothetical protein
MSFPGTQAVALADTGSTNTFMDYKFAIKHNIPMIDTEARTVVVAGGGKLVSTATAPNSSFTIQRKPFTATFKILQLQGSDIVLGVNRFKLHNPVTFDFVGRTVTLGNQDTCYAFPDHLVPEKHLLISADECSKLLDNGAEGYMLYSTDTPSTITGQTPLELQQLLQQFTDIFSEATVLPPHRAADHTIPLLPGAKPPNIRPYRMSHSQKNTIEAIIKQLLKKGEIQPSSSPFSSPVILVRKKDKSWQLCVDYRGLNDITVKNKFPIPVIEDLLDELHGATIFTKLDLAAGYHQIRMRTEDIPKTAFSTHLGHYEYTVMPFGLSNAPATFQELMNSIFSPYLRKFVLVFFDDILVYSSSMSQHEHHLQLVLNTLRNHELKAKLSKCSFGQPQVEYLGHIISSSGVATDPSKIQDIIHWDKPTTVKKLRGFLGLTGYYRRFIQGYATICQPLFAALKKDTLGS